MPVDLELAKREFQQLKNSEQRRNQDWYLLRQAVKGNFRWPRDWPAHIPKLKDNLCKRIVESFTTYLMGRGFSYNLDRPNTIEYRQNAERAEKILRRLLYLSRSEMQFEMGAKTGAKLGRTVLKVYKKGKPGAEHACFQFCQPDYFYGVPSADNNLGDYSTVYYSYPMDRLEAVRVFGPGDYKSEMELGRGEYYNELPEATVNAGGRRSDRKVPVLEIWSKDNYALLVGGVTKYNGENPYKWQKTGEGFIPFIVIENIRNDGEARGEGDIEQARELNEHLNQLISRKFHIVSRWLVPTLVWEGAPQNYADVLAQTIGGGGAVPTRLGSRLYFLAYDRANPAVLEMEQTLRAAILESAGMNEVALLGNVTGSVNTGPALQAQFAPVLSTVDKKRTEWTAGLKLLFAMLLELQEQIGASTALGEVVVNSSIKSADDEDGELVQLSGKDIAGLREVTISWPGVLPKDDAEQARLEMEKASQGLQSIYTTMEKLGEEYPDDELSRISMEAQDPNLRGDKVAEQMRAQAPLLKAQASAAQALGAGEEEEDLEEFGSESEEDLLAGGDFGARLREMRRRAPQLNVDGDEPVIASGY